MSRYLVQELGREPSPEEIEEKMELLLDKVRKVLKIAKELISPETPIGEEEDSHLGLHRGQVARLPVRRGHQHEPGRADAEGARHADAARGEGLGACGPGIGEKSDHTLEEVGQDFEVTRERIRQIEAKALSCTRALQAAEELRRELVVVM